MKRRLLAEILWEAANTRLQSDFRYTGGLWEFSCEAVADALGALDHIESRKDWDRFCKTPPMQFLKSLGCKVGAMNAFLRFGDGPERQGVRYMWLLLAMHVAEDEGIMVEVAS